jgi:hypothetical protein
MTERMMPRRNQIKDYPLIIRLSRGFCKFGQQTLAAAYQHPQGVERNRIQKRGRSESIPLEFTGR